MLAIALAGAAPAALATWDAGDAPVSYGTGTMDGASAHHFIDLADWPGLVLGATVDSDCPFGNRTECTPPDFLPPPGDGANGDDIHDLNDDGVDDEDGVTLPAGFDDGSGATYTVTVQVSDGPGLGFRVCGWVDFDLHSGPGDGTFDDDERVCVVHTDPACVTGDGTDYTCSLAFTVPDDFVHVPGENSYARFRLCPPAGVPGSTTGIPPSVANCDSPIGLVQGGEIEDHLITSTALPVSLAAFSSRADGPSLRLAWTTASETFNVGFAVHARVADGWLPLTRRPLPSRSGDSVTPRTYRTRVPLGGIAAADLDALALVSLDANGGEEWFGPFAVGRDYGDSLTARPIDWTVVRRQVRERMAALGLSPGQGHPRLVDRRPLERTLGRLNRGAAGARLRDPAASGDRADRQARITVTEPGMQRVTYEDLRAAGVDLHGVAVDSLAVGYKEAAVARVVRSRDRRFGPGDAVEFWGELADGEDALYIAHRVYWIGVDPERVVEARLLNRRPQTASTDHLAVTYRNRQREYDFSSPTGDPWLERRITSFGNAARASVTVAVETPPLAGQPARLDLVLAGITAWPVGDADHHVLVAVNGEQVADERTDGLVRWRISADLRPGLLRSGDNEITLTVAGDTGHRYDVVAIDRLWLRVPAALEARGERLLFEDDGLRAVDGFEVRGVDGRHALAYALSDDGGLFVLRVRPRTAHTGGGATARFAALAGQSARYWVSTAETLHRPPVTAGPDDRLSVTGGGLLVITHPAFLPDSDDHPLARYVAERRAAGWEPYVVDTHTIYRHYGWDMALPGAIPRFLADASRGHDFTHVLLVGGDCYDYRDHLGSGCVSFIPTRYTDTGQIIRYTPADALLVDIDGDEIADLAVGRWPVRTGAELDALVAKTLAWDEPAAGMRHAATAVWAADSADPSLGSFIGQAERMIDRLRRPVAGGSEPWPPHHIERVYLDDIAGAVAPDAVVRTARERLVHAINDGRTITGFSGHGSPAMWTFQGLLTPPVAAGLANAGRPTQVVALSCYTTYFVSPSTDTLAHRLVAGTAGAVAVHGAVALSRLDDNEALAGRVLDSHLGDQRTLGESILHARRMLMALDPLAYRDVAVNWSLLGDPTIRTGPQ